MEKNLLPHTEKEWKEIKDQTLQELTMLMNDDEYDVIINKDYIHNNMIDMNILFKKKD